MPCLFLTIIVEKDLASEWQTDGEMEGQVLTTVYDMQGKAIDRFNLFVAPNSRHSYTLKGRNSGIYLFVFNHNGRIGTQKVFITN